MYVLHSVVGAVHRISIKKKNQWEEKNRNFNKVKCQCTCCLFNLHLKKKLRQGKI